MIRRSKGDILSRQNYSIILPFAPNNSIILVFAPTIPSFCFLTPHLLSFTNQIWSKVEVTFTPSWMKSWEFCLMRIYCPFFLLLLFSFYFEIKRAERPPAHLAVVYVIKVSIEIKKKGYPNIRKKWPCKSPLCNIQIPFVTAQTHN